MLFPHIIIVTFTVANHTLMAYKINHVDIEQL